MIKLNLFPGGKSKAFTASYDDGLVQDVRLTELFRTYGIKATFNLNSRLFDKEECFDLGIPITTKRISESQVRSIYRGFEVAMHSCNHQMISLLPDQQQINEIAEDKRALERLVRYPVRGLALPYGMGSETIATYAKLCGIEYIRCVGEDRSMSLPRDFMNWKPTCRHASPDLMELGEKFLEPSSSERCFHVSGKPQVFLLMGHGYELDHESGGNGWGQFEKFLQRVGGKDNVWYATNIEIVEYVKAQRSLVISTDGDIIYNPSCLDVWVSVDEEPRRIPGGAVIAV